MHPILKLSQEYLDKKISESIFRQRAAKSLPGEKEDKDELIGYLLVILNNIIPHP